MLVMACFNEKTHAQFRCMHAYMHARSLNRLVHKYMLFGILLYQWTGTCYYIMHIFACRHEWMHGKHNTYACMHVCVHACMHACIYKPAGNFIIPMNIFACRHKWMHGKHNTYACMHACMCSFMHACMYVFIHACMNAYI